MKPTIRDIRNYRFSQADRLLLDANFWIYNYGPYPDTSDQRLWTYSNALGAMLAGGSHLYADPLVLSEFANRYARLIYQTEDWLVNETFKEFRNSSAFVGFAEDIADSLRRILGSVEKLDCNFASMNEDSLLQRFETGQFDFNDLLIAETCAAHNLTIVTHDSDYAQFGIPILTGNLKLLQQR